MSEDEDNQLGGMSDLNEVETAALDWFLLLQEKGGDVGTRAQFQAWLAADRRHRPAYEAVKASWDEADLLKTAFNTPDPVEIGLANPRTTRPVGAKRPHYRRSVLWGGALAACTALFIFSAPELALRLKADHRTSVGEQARVDLPDGSLAWLNTDTAIAVDYTGEARVISLLRGEAEFEVQHDADRPFSVRAEGGRTTALGTVYTVRDKDDRVDVSVREGRVAVTSPAGAGGPTMELSAGQRVSYTRGGTPTDLSAMTAPPSPWREGVIIFEDTPLDEALAELDRYHRGRILLLSDKSDLTLVSARLSIADLDEAMDLLAATNGLSVTRLSDYLIIIR